MRTYAIHQLMSAGLYHEDGQRDSFTRHVIREHADAVSLQNLQLVGEPRIAYSFGQLRHSDAHRNAPEPAALQCDERCEIVPCLEDEATVVLMRVELDLLGDEPVQEVDE